MHWAATPPPLVVSVENKAAIARAAACVPVEAWLHLQPVYIATFPTAGAAAPQPPVVKLTTVPPRTLASVGLEPAAPVIDMTGAVLDAAVGSVPLLLVTKSLTPANKLAASFLMPLLREFRCRAGTARNTIKRITAAMARTIKTSMIVKPSCRFC